MIKYAGSPSIVRDLAPILKLSKRELFALMILNGHLSNGIEGIWKTDKVEIERCVHIADSLIEALKEKPLDNG